MAASRVKGITIEIGGDTTGLQKALSGVNTTIKNTQAQLRDVNNLLKLDPTNTELLGQKHRLLTEKIGATKEKLDTLKTAQEQVRQQFENGDIGIEQYEALQREIISTEEYLKDLQNTVGSGSAKLAEISAKTGEFGEKATKAGQALMPVTAGLTAVGAAGLAAFKDVDAGLDIIITKTGATGEAAEEMEAIFSNVYGNFPADSEAVGSAIGEINTRLGFTGQTLDDASVKFLKFADINGTDVNTAVQLVSRAMGDAGIDANEYGTILDQLTAASQASGISIDTLTENLTKYGAPMRQLGFDTESAIAIFSQWEKAGVNTEIAFSGMKKAIGNWTKAGKDGKEEFANFVKGVQDGSISAQEALNVFGTKAGPDLVDAIQAGRFSYEDFMTVIENSSGTVEQTFEDTQDPIDQFTVAMNNAKLALAEVGDALASTLAPILQAVSEKLKNFTQWFSGLSDSQKDMIVKIGMVIAALGPLLIIVGKVSMAISSITGLLSKAKVAATVTSAVSKIKTVLSGLWAFIAANPIVVAIAVIIAAVVLLYTKCEWFRDAVNAVWDKIKTAFLAAWSGITTFFKETLPNVWNAVVSWVQGIPEWWSGIWQTVGDFFAGIWSGICSFFTETIPAAWQSVVSWFQGIPEWWSGIWQQVHDFFTNIWTMMMQNPVLSSIVNTIQSLWENLVTTLQNVWTNIQTIASAAWELIKNIILGPVLLLIDLVTGNFGKLKEDAANIWENIKTAASTIWTALKDLVGNVVQGLATHVTTLITGLKDTLGNLWEMAKTAASTAWTNLKNTVVTTATNLKDSAIQAVTNLKESVAQAWENMKSSASLAWQNIKDFVTQTAENLKQSALEAFENLISGIRDTLSSLGSVVSDGFQSAISFITSLPSQAIEWGRDFIMGIVDGIRGAISWVTDAVTDVADTIRSFLHFSVPDVGPLTDYESWMPDFMQGLAKGIEKSKSIVADAIAGVSKDMTINANAMVEQSGAKQNNAIMNIASILMQYLPYLAQGTTLQWETGEVAAKLAPDMNRQLGILAVEEGQL